MVSATPTNVGEVLRQLLDEALSKAADQPQQLSDWFDQVENDANKIVDQVQQVPGNLAQRLQEPPFRPPDWWSLLVFTLLRIKELLNDPRLTVGYRHPAGWSRMVTVNFSDNPMDIENSVVATVGVALTDPGVSHGIWLQVLKDFDFDLGGGALRVKMSAKGKADWQYTFGAAMAKPATPAQAGIDVSWTPWDAGLHAGGGAFSFDLGPIHLHLALSAPADPLYALTLGLGSETSQAGVAVAVDAHQALGSALASFIDIAPIGESYSPQLVLTKGGSPQFTLGHRGVV